MLRKLLLKMSKVERVCSKKYLPPRSKADTEISMLSLKVSS